MNRLSPNWRHYTHVKRHIFEVNCIQLCVIFEPLWSRSFKQFINSTDFWFLFQLYKTSMQVPHVSLDSICCLLIPFVQPIVHEWLLNRFFYIKTTQSKIEIILNGIASEIWGLRTSFSFRICHKLYYTGCFYANHNL